MKKSVAILAVLFIAFTAHAHEQSNLLLLENDAQVIRKDFNNLVQHMSVSKVSDAIVFHNEQMLEAALGDLMFLTKTVNAQINIASQFWNMYVDNVKKPTMETYLLGQVMNSLMGTIRALSMRSSVDQAMILNLIKSSFIPNGADEPIAQQEAQKVAMESRWKSMLIL